VRLRGLTDSKEGRLVVIGVIGGTLLVAAAILNLTMGRAADASADDVRVSLRRELAMVSDETIDDYPDSAPTIERMAVKAVGDRPARVLGTARPDGEEIVVAVQSGWGWQVRCVKAELRGDATVLTYVTSRPC
jgi:hypothetical protein